ncbi:meiotic recombination protein REC8 homolog [Sphaeramia orbicularis]|uniref:meiotic recombination protein REC8 homolog n=1 Tax=Sphaeramia orbicularis TaxID=375764 RepID=UPI001180D3D3|nr:meiotic recombination protein REC8 homolog [Sphaeramia orbicularis]
MFYYPAVLKRHTGCFSTIWLVATKGIKISRQDFLKVNVTKTCGDIMNYLLERVEPPRPGLPRPRFSLYLSSQLQYGVVVVYHRQCVIFLEEIQTVVERLLKQKPFQKIDMDDRSRPSLLLTDPLSLMMEADGILDPAFGVMQQDVPSPSALIQMSQMYVKEASPAQFEVSRTSTAAEIQTGITASPDEITLREMEPLMIPSAEFEGMELAEDHPQTIDILLAQTDQFPEGYSPPLSPVRTPSERRRRRRAESEREPSPEVTQRRRRKGRRRQLIFFDQETQLSQREQQQRIDDPMTDTTHPPLIPPPSRRTPSVTELFNNPCTSLPEELLFLWRQAATITPLSGSDLQVGERGPESTDSEKEREREMLEMAEMALREKEQEEEEEVQELSHKEIPREMAEAEMLDISGPGSLPLEGSDQMEASREMSPLYTSDREGSIVSRLPLQDIPEEPADVPGRGGPGFPGLLPELAEHEEGPVLFRSLLPPDADRRTVSNCFMRLLGGLSSRSVRVEQQEPYGDIVIITGSAFY